MTKHHLKKVPIPGDLLRQRELAPDHFLVLEVLHRDQEVAWLNMLCVETLKFRSIIWNITSDTYFEIITEADSAT